MKWFQPYPANGKFGINCNNKLSDVQFVLHAVPQDPFLCTYIFLIGTNDIWFRQFSQASFFMQMAQVLFLISLIKAYS